VSRCGAVYPNGTVEILPANPATHRRLRGLGYSRFLVKVQREADRATFSAPVYASSQPSMERLTEVAARLWGFTVETIHVFDDDGVLLATE
jgi:hypothetical protein